MRNNSAIYFPPEIFTNVCYFLPPQDLFTLSQVCREFRGYLCAPNCFSTQQIWKESRIQFMPEEEMPPPDGMCEEKYIELLLTERGCQICRRNKKCKIHWVFEVRSCEECFNKKTVTEDRLLEINCPHEFLEIMPNTIVNRLKYFWVEQIDLAYRQYFELSKKGEEKKKLNSWLNDRKQTYDSIMKYARPFSLAYYRDYLDYCIEYHHKYYDDVFTPLSRPPPTPLILSILIKIDVPPSLLSTLIKNDVFGLNLTQPHIKRIENELYQSKHKRENNAKKKKSRKRKFYGSKKNMKGKISKDKFIYRYG